jgi:hypothetical protein
MGAGAHLGGDMILARFSAVAFAFLCVLASAAHAENLSGHYEGKVFNNSNQELGPMTGDITDHGNGTVTGTGSATIEFAGASITSKGDLTGGYTGNQFHADLNGTIQGTGARVTCKVMGTINGNTISGTFHSPELFNLTGKFTLTLIHR